ncbi:MAG: ABC transporter ATP-binding protein [Candidatus Lernaella stagnicola]|nr:ABC transporter ATP-binding protein [Candidatus Lernaella stagnicola]
MPSLIDVTDLQVHFATPRGPARAVDGVSFALAPGEIVGLVGESGCGKSVTALSLMGLLPAKGCRISGSVRWQGRELLGRSEDEWRALRGREIAMIFQDPMTSLNPVFTVGNQIGEVLTKRAGLPSRAARSRAAELLAEVGIDDAKQRLRAYPGQLSGGMRQRVMIAMAMAARPKLLIADEPTTALDVTTQAQVLRLIDELRRRTGAAVLFITHDLGVVAELCERVVVLYAGRMAETAPVGALFDTAAHPYTRGLLRAVRMMDKGGVEAAIPGRVAPATDYPAGCRFHPRCSEVMDVCRTNSPPVFRCGAAEVACWLHRETPADVRE